MDDFFLFVEGSWPSVWLRESLSIFAFPGVLTLHTIGLAFLSGIAAAIDLRVLGVAAALPLAPMQRFFPFFWGALWLSVVTGVGLVVAYPVKAFTNPLFWVKLVLVGLAVGATLALRRALRRDASASTASGTPRPPGRREKRLAALSLGSFAAAIVAGRLLAYTYSRLLMSLDF